MSRSGYNDDCEDNWAHICWRGAVSSAIRGGRGQAMLKELVDALDALPDRRLTAGSLETEDGEFCALGALGRARNLDMATIDPEDREAVALAFGVSEALAAEVMYLNDEAVSRSLYVNVDVCGPMRRYEQHIQIRRVPNERQEEMRWSYMRQWAVQNLTPKTEVRP